MPEPDAWDALNRRDLPAAEAAFKAMRAHDPLGAAFGLGYVYAWTGRFDEARGAYQLVLDDARARQDPQREHMALHQLGMVAREAGDLGAARELFEQERNLIGVLGDPPLAVSANAYELGFVALQLGELAAADEQLTVALDAGRLSGDLVAVACALRARGEWYRAQNQREAARAALEEAAANFRAANEERSAQEALALRP